MGQILFRNFKITDVRTVSNKDGPLCRIHGSSDLTGTVCEEMGWDITVTDDQLRGGIKTTGLDGDLNLSELSLIPNGNLKGLAVKNVPAVTARNFQVVRSEKKGKGDKPSVIKTRLSFVLTLPNTSASTISNYHLGMNNGDAQLRIKVIGDEQMSLMEQQSEEAEEEATKAEPAIASAREIPGAGRKRDKGVQ